MYKAAKLEREDIVTRQYFNNIEIDCGDVHIIFSVEAAAEFVKDVVSMASGACPELKGPLEDAFGGWVELVIQEPVK